MITREDIVHAEAAGREALLTLVEALASENATLRARIKELEDWLLATSQGCCQPYRLPQDLPRSMAHIRLMLWEPGRHSGL